jgi:hypothetical protein
MLDQLIAFNASLNTSNFNDENFYYNLRKYVYLAIAIK